MNAEAAREVRVELGERGYTVFVGPGLLRKLDRILIRGAWNRAVLVTDSIVGDLYGPGVLQCLGELGLKPVRATIEPGEGSKRLSTAGELLDAFAGAQLTRGDLVVALGGGVVGDIAGFSASIFKRGLSLLQLPTTLMAQVDSSVGGKTAVDLESGKNLAGTFHQPVAVVSDVQTLDSLPEREFKAGLAEVAKYGFIRPGCLPEPLPGLAPTLGSRSVEALTEVVTACVEAKAGIVALDETDRGERAVLNYGHTLGHALESATGFSGVYSHGEAVSVGMVFAAMVSEALGTAPGGLLNDHLRDLEALGLPVEPFKPAPSQEKIVQAVRQDKKSRGGITMILIDSTGKAVINEDVPQRIFTGCYARLLEVG